MNEFVTKSEKETFNLGGKFVKKIKNRPTLILLKGPVGAGKTCWTKGFVWAYLKEKDVVSSPTFSLINRYKKGKREVIHVDLYRLSDEDDFESIGFWDLLEEKAIVITEWGDHLENIPPELPKFFISFEIVDEKSRRVSVGD